VAELPTPTTAASAKSPAGRTVWARGFICGARLALIGCLAWATWSSATAWGRLLGWSETEAPAPSQQDTEYLEGALAALPAVMEGGRWSFPGTAWQIAVAEVSAADLEQKLAAPLAVGSMPGQVSAEETHWLQVIKNMMIKSPDSDMYRLDLPDFRARAIVRTQQGQERLIAGRLAWKMEQRRWQLLEVRPGLATTASAAQGSAFLPLPDSGQRLCTRSDRQGTPLCEVIALPQKLSELRDYWIQHGWDVREVLDSAGGTNLLCVRDGRVVNVWAGEAPVEGGTVLLLFRGSAVAKQR
jgi:hypothetical protein